MKIGYARVSSVGQSLEAQKELLLQAGCEKIFEEKKSGTEGSNRPVLKETLEFVRHSDEFIVTRLDRCSRSVKDLHDILEILETKGVAFIATQQNLETKTATGKLMLNILGSIAEFETELRKERQIEGIEKAKAIDKAKGIESRFGRSSKMNDEQITRAIEMKAEGIISRLVAEHFKVSKSTLLKHIAEYNERCVNEEKKV